MKIRYLLASLCFLLLNDVDAQQVFNARAAKIGLNLGLGLPLGGFKSGENVLGFAKNGLYGELLWLDIPIKKKVLLSLSMTAFSPKIEPLEAEDLFQIDLSETKYFVEKSERQDAFYDLGIFSAGLKLPLQYRRFSVEPSIAVGYGFFRMLYWVNYDAKERGSNYTKRIDVDSGLDYNGALAWKAGLRLNCFVNHRFGIQIGADFAGLKARDHFKKTITDLLGSNSEEQISVNSKIAAFGLSIGAWVRISK